MKSFTAIVLAIAIPAFAQTVADLPQCAQNPILLAIQASGCPITDIPCICGNKGFVDGLLEVIPTVCTPEQTTFVSGFAVRLCGAADVTLSLPTEVLSATTVSAPSSLSLTTSSSISITSTETSTSTTVVVSNTTVSTSGPTTTGSSASTPAPTSTVPPNAAAAQTAGLIGLVGAVVVGVLGGL